MTLFKGIITKVWNRRVDAHQFLIVKLGRETQSNVSQVAFWVLRVKHFFESLSCEETLNISFQQVECRLNLDVISRELVYFDGSVYLPFQKVIYFVF